MTETTTRDLRLGRVGGLDILAGPSAAAGTVVLTVIFAAIGRYAFHHGIANAVVGGLVLALLHWVSEVVHNVGHGTAARRSGHPMTGGRLGFLLVLGTSLYPHDEPALPASVHIRRALGGPIASAALTVAIGALALLLSGSSTGWVALVWFLDNLLIFTLGAFVPLGFSDGSTLIHWMRHD
jgi:hypothetical protein